MPLHRKNEGTIPGIGHVGRASDSDADARGNSRDATLIVRSVGVGASVSTYV